ELPARVIVQADVLERSDPVREHHAGERDVDSAPDVQDTDVLVDVLLKKELENVRPPDAVTHVVPVDEDPLLGGIDRQVSVVDGLATNISHSSLLSGNEKAHLRNLRDAEVGCGLWLEENH